MWRILHPSECLIIALLMLPFQITLVPLYEFMHQLGLVNTIPGLIVPRTTNAFGIFFMRQFFLSPQYSLITAGSVLALLPIVAMFLLGQKSFVQGLATTGVK